MTITLDASAFAAARDADRRRASAELCARRAAARAERDRAREAFTEQGDPLIATEADLLEDIAERVVAFVDDLEPLMRRLQVARDQPGEPRRRSPWRRGHLAMCLAEGFDGLLSPSALALTLAAVEVQAAP